MDISSDDDTENPQKRTRIRSQSDDEAVHPNRYTLIPNQTHKIADC